RPRGGPGRGGPRHAVAAWPPYRRQGTARLAHSLQPPQRPQPGIYAASVGQPSTTDQGIQANYTVVTKKLRSTAKIAYCILLSALCEKQLALARPPAPGGQPPVHRDRRVGRVGLRRERGRPGQRGR